MNLLNFSTCKKLRKAAFVWKVKYPEAEANFYLAVHAQIFDMIFEDSGLIFLGEPIIDESLSQTGFAYGSIPHYDHFDR